MFNERRLFNSWIWKAGNGRSRRGRARVERHPCEYMLYVLQGIPWAVGNVSIYFTPIPRARTYSSVGNTFILIRRR